MGWRDKVIVSIDLGKVGFEGWKAKVLKMGYLTLAETSTIKEPDQQSIDTVAKVLAIIVLEWNIPDPEDDAKIIALPKDSTDWINKVPIGVINEIVRVASEGVVAVTESFR